MVSMYKDWVTSNVVPKFIDCINNNKKLFLSYCVIKLCSLQIFADIVNGKWLLKFLLPKNCPYCSVRCISMNVEWDIPLRAL